MLNKTLKKNPKKLALNLFLKKSSPLTTTETNAAAVQPSISDMQYKNESLLYRQGPACILPNLYLGAHYNASNAQQLAQFNIRCIINVASEISISSLPNTIVYHHLHWTHRQNNLARVEFAQAISKIEYAHSQQQNILIHCQQGIERSAALVIAYLLFSSRQAVKITSRSDNTSSSHLAGQNWTLDCALKYVQERAPGIRPNMELLYQLREYEKLINPTPHNTAVAATALFRTRTRRSESITDSTSLATTRKRMPTSSSVRNLATATVIHTRQRASSFKDISPRTFSHHHTSTTSSALVITANSSKDKEQKVLATTSLLVVLAAIYHNQQQQQLHNFIQEGEKDEVVDGIMIMETEQEEKKANNHLRTGRSFFLMKPVYPIY